MPVVTRLLPSVLRIVRLQTLYLSSVFAHPAAPDPAFAAALCIQVNSHCHSCLPCAHLHSLLWLWHVASMKLKFTWQVLCVSCIHNQKHVDVDILRQQVSEYKHRTQITYYVAINIMAQGTWCMMWLSQNFLTVASVTSLISSHLCIEHYQSMLKNALNSIQIWTHSRINCLIPDAYMSFLTKCLTW